MLSQATALGADTEPGGPISPTAPKLPHFPATAKRVIFLFMHGGPSGIDTFDPKERLTRDNGKPLPVNDPDWIRFTNEMAQVGKAAYRASQTRNQQKVSDLSGDIADKEVLDAALIASAQAVEHYEITRYGTLIAWAKQLGRSDCANVLANNLKEEVATDRKLTEMAESKINMQAAE